MNYNYFYFYLQTLKMGANDASGEGLQYAQKQNFDKVMARTPVFGPNTPVLNLHVGTAVHH